MRARVRVHRIITIDNRNRQHQQPRQRPTIRLHSFTRSSQSINSPNKRLTNFQVHAMAYRHIGTWAAVNWPFFSTLLFAVYLMLLPGAYWFDRPDCVTVTHTHTRTYALVHTPIVLLTFQVAAIAEYSLSQRLPTIEYKFRFFFSIVYVYPHQMWRWLDGACVIIRLQIRSNQ